MMHRFFRHLRQALVVVTLLLGTPLMNLPLSGQIRVEKGEEVKVKVLGSWTDGTVVEINPRKRSELMVAYEFAGNTKQKVFQRKEVRRLYEFEGLDFGRMWTSEGGKFKIEASLLEIKGEEVTLIQPDMEKISVPLNKLSRGDNLYVKKFKTQREKAVRAGQVPDQTPALPDIEDFGGGGPSSSFATIAQTRIEPLGPLPSYLREFQQAGTGFNKIRKNQKLISVIPVGGPEQLVLMTFREKNPFKSGTNFQSQLYWVSLRQKKVLSYISITHEDYGLDYHPQHELLLTFNRNEEFIGQTDEPSHYTIWKAKPVGTEAEPLVRWECDGMGWAQHQFAKIISDRIVVIKTKKNTLEAFDFVARKSLYQVSSQSFFDAPVVLSPDRRHLILPEDGRVSVVDAETGKIEISVSVKDRHVSGANINQDGTRLAAITERNIYVWDLKSGSPEPKIYPAPLMGSPFKSRLEWVDDDHLLGQSHTERILYRLSLGLPVWSYKMDVAQYFLNRDPLKNMVIDGRFFYVAQPDVWGKSIAVGAVDLPGPRVAEVTAQIDRESLYALKPGVPVAIEVSGVSQPDQVQRWLIEKIKANQWKYDPEADIVMVASMGQGRSRTIQYQDMGGRGTPTTVTFQPHFANLKLKRGETIIWQTGTATAPPSVVSGKNIQAKVNQYQRPRLNFFKGVRIDARILDPKYSRGFGVSKLGLRGIEVVSTSPPGREDDPRAAAEQADRDQKKAAEEEGKQDQKDGSPQGNDP